MQIKLEKIKLPVYYFALLLPFLGISQAQQAASPDTLNKAAPSDSFYTPEQFQGDSSSLGFKQQFGSAMSVLKKSGITLLEKIRQLSKTEEDSILQRKPSHLEQSMREEFYKLTKDQTEVKLIKAWELMKIYEDTNVILIDVRKPEEQAVSMIPGSLSPVEFTGKFRTPLSLSDKLIVTYCTIGYRSGIYAKELMAKKLIVRNLEGGLLAWSHNKGLFIKKGKDGKSESTKEVHVYSKEWNFLHPDYKAKW
jgi:sodium/bile acid cotransporter 7